MYLEQNYDMKVINQFLQEVRERYTIYLDMDGVICDLDTSFENLGYGGVDSILDRGGEGLFFGLIGKAGIKFWTEMPWMQGGKELWDYVNQYPVKILSAPTNNPNSIKGKNIWIDRNLGKDVERIIVPAKQKKNYADQHSILIDDMSRNITQWRLAGGIAILHKNAETTIKKLKEMLG